MSTDVRCIESHKCPMHVKCFYLPQLENVGNSEVRAIGFSAAASSLKAKSDLINRLQHSDLSTTVFYSLFVDTLSYG